MSVAEKETLGQEFRRVRKFLGMTQREAADYCGVSPESVSLWENGHRQFNSLEQQKLIRQSLNRLKRRQKWRTRRQ
jgi:transcriptional regulator with XRE-family HTH domain